MSHAHAPAGLARPPARPRALGLAMAGVERLWARGVLPPPDCDLGTIRRQAERQARLDDHGDTGFLDRQAGVLLPALEREARLNSLGRLVAHGTLLKVHVDRLRLVDLVRRHPEVEAEVLAPPVVVMGAMRSGTTRVQRLLAAHPGFTTLSLYECLFPVPGPDSFAARARGRADPRIARARWGYRFLCWANPMNRHTHPTGATEPDEELGLLEQSLAGAQIEAQRRVPAFARHCEQTDQRPAYAHLVLLLKLRQWFTGDRRPLVLKTPHHMQDLPALASALPQARYVFVHRDPVEVVPSAASLAFHQMVVQSDEVDPAWVGAEWLHKTEHRFHAAEAARPLIPADRQIDVRHADLDAGWLGEMRRVLAVLGAPADGAAMTAMTASLDHARRHHRLSAHRYSAESFGLDREALAERFCAYRARWGLDRPQSAASSFTLVSASRER